MKDEGGRMKNEEGFHPSSFRLHPSAFRLPIPGRICDTSAMKQRPTIFFPRESRAGTSTGRTSSANCGRNARRFGRSAMAGRTWPRQGAELHADLTALAVMWFARVLLNLHKFWGLVSRADRYFRHHRPDAVVLIDYPGLNWWIARRAKVHGIPRLLLYAAADLGLGDVAGGEDAAAGGSCAVQSAVRGGVAPRARLQGDLRGASVFRRGAAAAPGRAFHMARAGEIRCRVGRGRRAKPGRRAPPRSPEKVMAGLAALDPACNFRWC